jgi:hypothetical protein
MPKPELLVYDEKFAHYQEERMIKRYQVIMRLIEEEIEIEESRKKIERKIGR